MATRPKTSGSVRADEGWSDSDVGVKEALLESAAEEQRSKGMMPTPNDNDVLIADILNTFDRKGGGATDETPSEKKSGDEILEKEFKRRGGKGDPHEWTTVKGEPEVIPFDRPSVQDGSAVRTEAGRRIDLRLAQLRATPGWMERVKHVMRSYHGDEQKRRLAKILQESNKHFGHWAKDPAKPLWFS